MAPQSKTAKAARAAGRLEDQAPTPSEYTRSALPLALTWFLLPMALLILSTALFGRF